jgi:hypothetical protein
MGWLWGVVGKSFIDVWTLAHLSFWLFVGSLLWPVFSRESFWSRPRMLAFGLCLIAAYGWELFERFAEKRWPQLWLHPESWLNSYVSDPLTTVVGVLGMMYLLDRFAK